jgi:hypothetical protein
MRCHEVLGIDERATVSDIMLAYDNKKSFLNGDIPASAEQIQAKLHELNSAKDDCIAWASMNFASKTAKRVDEYSSNCFSQNRLNEVCIGPCTCTDVCGGMLCSCGSNSDSFLVSCCGCESPWIAILCDIAIYVGAVFSDMRNKRQENEKRREEEAAKKAAELRNQATKRLSELHNELDIIKKNIEEANIKISDAEMTLNVYRMFTSFFYSLGCSYDGVPETMQELLDDLVSKREKHSTLCAKQKEIEKRINEQERILQQNR